MTNDLQNSESSLPMTVTVFVSDPTAEAERVSEALRAAGFQVIDVPLSMLVARVAVQRPHVVIVDADAEGALEAIARLREIPECESIDLLFTGRAASLPSSMESAAAAKEGVPSNAMTAALAFEGSGFFARPLDPDAIVKKVSALSLGGGRSSAPPKKSSRPPSEAPSSEAPSSRGGMSRKNLSQPPPRLLPGASASMRTAPLSQQLEQRPADPDVGLVRRAFGVFAQLHPQEHPGRGLLNPTITRLAVPIQRHPPLTSLRQRQPLHLRHRHSCSPPVALAHQPCRVRTPGCKHVPPTVRLRSTAGGPVLRNPAHPSSAPVPATARRCRRHRTATTPSPTTSAHRRDRPDHDRTLRHPPRSQTDRSYTPLASR